MPKKKKGAEKEKKAKKKPWINEKETVSYEQQILDYNRQLARLRSRNEHLEDEVEVLKSKLTQLEDDRSDVVAHLKRILLQRTEEARELGDRLLAMEELRKEEQVAYKNKEDAMQLEYHTMETNLSAEVKLAAGKLSALEDWRLARIDLMRKFEIQEEQMAEQEERLKQTVYEAEKSLIVGKAKMQKEMEERLNDLAQSFREATNIRIADATHRAIRENIALNQELDAMYKVCRELEGQMKEYKEKERNHRLHASLFQSEAQMALRKLLEQNRLIDSLANENFNMSLVQGKIGRESARKVLKEKILQDYRDKTIEAQQKSRILEQNIQRTKEAKADLEKETRDNCREITRLQEVLRTAQRYIAKIAQLQEKITADCMCSTCSPDFEEKLRVLMDILKIKGNSGAFVIDDLLPIESEFSERSFRPLIRDYSVRFMQEEVEYEDATMKESEGEILASDDLENAPDSNTLQNRLTVSSSSNVTLRKGTESLSPADSEDE